MQDTPPDILLVYKSSGISSFDVIRRLRKKLNVHPHTNCNLTNPTHHDNTPRYGVGVKKMGHAGTLDPLATGLMIIGINKGTKLLSHYLKLPKTYDAEIILGTRTDSGDITGTIIEKKTTVAIDDSVIHTAAKTLMGVHLLAVPSYSAIKVNGVRLYKRAHRGEKNIETPIKEMTVTDFTVKNIQHLKENIVISATIDVASGTYIRTIAEEFGKRLGYPATIKSLRRTQIGSFTLEGVEQI
jgi:tRNA pseudouridine55 synthase